MQNSVTPHGIKNTGRPPSSRQGGCCYVKGTARRGVCGIAAAKARLFSRDRGKKVLAEGRKSRVVYNFASTMYALIKEIAARCHDEAFKKAAQMILNDIEWESNQ